MRTITKEELDKYCKYTVRGYERMPFRESLARHFKAVKDTGCNCLFCRNLNKEPK